MEARFDLIEEFKNNPMLAREFVEAHNSIGTLTWIKIYLLVGLKKMLRLQT